MARFGFGIDGDGVVFCDIGTALREHHRLVAAHIDPALFDDEEWTGGTFVYVSPGARLALPIQDRARADRVRTGRLERNLIIADEGAEVHYVEGCSAPVYTSDPDRCESTDIVVKAHAELTYTSMRNWSANVTSRVEKRARVETCGELDWTDASFGSGRSQQRSVVELAGVDAALRIRLVTQAGVGQVNDNDVEVTHGASGTRAEVTSKSISHEGGVTTANIAAAAAAGCAESSMSVRADALVLDERSTSTVALPDDPSHETGLLIDAVEDVRGVSASQLFYLMTRGLSEQQSVALIVNGFIEPVTAALPMEYAVEWARLVELQIEGSVG